MRDYYTTTEVGKLLNLDPSLIRRYIRAGHIEAVAVTERMYLIAPAEVRKFRDKPRRKWDKSKKS